MASLQQLLLGDIKDDGWRSPLQQKYFTSEMAEQYDPLRDAMQRLEDSDGLDEDAKRDFEVHFETFKNFECFSTWNGVKYDIVFYGVSGYTGYLMMEYLKLVSLKINPEIFTFAFAGRTPSKVAEMRDREFAGTRWADTPILQASFDNIHSMIDLAKSAHVIVNVAGPYMATEGEILVDACVHLKTHYVDISGEMPWTHRLLDLHRHALDNGCYVIPSAAQAGGFPDLATYMLAKKARDEYGSELRKVTCYACGGGAPASASGGTLKTRSVMAEAGDDARMLMADIFAAGGFIPDVDRFGIKKVDIEFGTGKCTAKPRAEDLDVQLSKVQQDKRFGFWRGPHTYSYFDTRIVRRSNMLLADFADEPYGRRLNWLEHCILPGAPEAKKVASASVEAEKAALKAAGKYYEEGDGPPLEDLSDAWTGFCLHAETEDGHELLFSMRGRDGYFETARAAIEMAMTLRFDREQLRFPGGVLTATVAGGEAWARRLLHSGMVFKVGSFISEDEHYPPPLK